MTSKTLSRFCVGALCLLSVPAGRCIAADTASHNQSGHIETPQMAIDFTDGWLTKWQNRQTGETVDFGRADIDAAAKDQRHYIPGTWSPDWKLAKGTVDADADVRAKLEKVDDTAIVFTQSASRTAGDVCALQWSVHIPYDKVDTIRIPEMLAPERLVGNGCFDDAVLRPSSKLGGRLGADHVRNRCYAIQAKTGGLLIYMDDPDFKHFMQEEYRKAPKELTMTVRSVCEPPWQNSYAGPRWIIRQYTGSINQAAQIYQDYLRTALHMVPLDERRTAWARDVALCFVGSSWGLPLPIEGKTYPAMNYSRGWEDSLKVSRQWLDNLAQVADPSKVMFYTAGWRVAPGVDSHWPDTAVDPYFARIVGEVRKRGFHVMLHFNNIYMNWPGVFYQRYLANQSSILGLDYIQGAGVDAIDNKPLGNMQKDFLKGSPAWAQGVSGVQNMDIMNPAFEGWRYLFSGYILSTVRATGADAIHLDVPIEWVDMNNDRYGMTCQQGFHEFYKLLRKTFDENGLQNVAIATEVMPPESVLPYVDFAQMSRDKSVAVMLNGEYGVPETFGAEKGVEYDKVIKAREDLAAMEKDKRFNPDLVRTYLSNMRELGEPSFKTMIVSQFVRPYPHLGVMGPTAGGTPKDPNRMINNRVFQVLRLWYDMSVDCCIHEGAQLNEFIDCPPWDTLDAVKLYRKRAIDGGTRYQGKMFNRIDYGKYALVRFWQANAPKQVEPKDFQKGDIVRYRLKDGRVFFVTRSSPTTLRWAFGDGTTLAELDLFDGWKNDQQLMKDYEPSFLKNQLDQEPAANGSAAAAQ